MVNPQERIPVFRWSVQEAMVREMKGERWFTTGMWIPNTIQPVWELGKRWGTPEVNIATLDLNGQNAFMPGPADHRRWFVIAVFVPATTGNTRLMIRPKDASVDDMFLTANSNVEQAVLLPYPGLIVENDGDRFGGGDIGLGNTANAGDTARIMRILFYEEDM